MRLRFSEDQEGTLWIRNPVGTSNAFIARTPVRALLLGPMVWTLLWVFFSAVGVGHLALHPLTLAVIAAALVLYLRTPKAVDPAMPLRLGFSPEALVIERFSGAVDRLPWSAVSSAKVSTGALFGARLSLETASGFVEVPMLNWDLAFRALWAQRLAASGGLDPAALRDDAPLPEPVPAPPPEARPIDGSDPRLAFSDECLFATQEGRVIPYSRPEVDLVDFSLAGSTVLLVVARGQRVSIVSKDPGIEAVRGWHSAAEAQAAARPLLVAKEVATPPPQPE